jgi:hypothetical protein
VGLHRGYIHLCWIDHFEYFAETGCKADGRVGIGIIRRFSGLGEGDNYVFFSQVRNVSVVVKGF